MTIPATEPLNSDIYEGNDVTTTFAFPFQIYEASDIRVDVEDAAGDVTSLVLDTDYTVAPTGGDYPAKGTITLTAPLATGESLIIRPNIALSQERAFSNQSSLSLRQVEDAFDKVTSMVRTIEERLGDELLQGSFGGGVELPGSLLIGGALTVTGTVNSRDIGADGAKLDGLGQGARPFPSRADFLTYAAANTPTAGDLAYVVCGADTGEVVCGYRYVGGAVSRFTETDLDGWVPVAPVMFQHYGAACDGTTDDTTAAQKAAADTEETVIVLSGKMRIATGKLTFKDTTVLGLHRSLVNMNVTDADDIFGSMLICDFLPAVDDEFIRLDRGGVLRDLTLFCSYQTKLRETGWTPTTTPWAVRGGDWTKNSRDVQETGQKLIDVAIIDFTHGIKANKGFQQGNIERVIGNPFTVGFEADGCYDKVRLTDIHFWPFGGNTGVWQIGEQEWVAQNATAFRVGRVDGLVCRGIFAIGYANAVEFYPSETGDVLDGRATSFASFVQCYLDYANTCVRMDGVYTGGDRPSARFVNCVLQHNDADGNAGTATWATEQPIVDVSSDITELSFIGCSFASSGGDTDTNIIRFSGDGKIVAQSCLFAEGDDDGSGTPYFISSGTGLIEVVGPTFLKNDKTQLTNSEIITKPLAEGNVVIRFAGEGVVQNNIANSAQTLELQTFSADATGSRLSGSKARGDQVTPAIVQNGDILMELRGQGFDGTDFDPAGYLRLLAASPTSGRVPGEWRGLVKSGSGTFVNAFTSSASAFTVAGTFASNAANTEITHASGEVRHTVTTTRLLEDTPRLLLTDTVDNVDSAIQQTGGDLVITSDVSSEATTPELRLRVRSDTYLTLTEGVITASQDIVQQPSATITPAANGDLVVEATDNTTLTFKLKGTDGTVRSGTITLS